MFLERGVGYIKDLEELMKFTIPGLLHLVLGSWLIHKDKGRLTLLGLRLAALICYLIIVDTILIYIFNNQT